MERALASIFAFEGLIPVIDPAAFVHPTATLIGDVIVGAGCYVGPGAVLRGDLGRLVLHTGSNVQDTCVLHTFPGGDVVIEQDGHVGHGAVLHGCRIGLNAMIGINAVVLDGAEIGPEAIVAAGAVVTAGFKVPERALVGGIPAKLLRKLDDADVARKSHGTMVYQDLAARSLRTMRRVAPLTTPEANRPRLPTPAPSSTAHP